ncbi:MAG: hypothetical protein ACRELY_09415, partial [Polyangiaceae bacterium]
AAAFATTRAVTIFGAALVDATTEDVMRVIATEKKAAERMGNSQPSTPRIFGPNLRHSGAVSVRSKIR